MQACGPWPFPVGHHSCSGMEVAVWPAVCTWSDLGLCWQSGMMQSFLMLLREHGSTGTPTHPRRSWCPSRAAYAMTSKMTSLRCSLWFLPFWTASCARTSWTMQMWPWCVPVSWPSRSSNRRPAGFWRYMWAQWPLEGGAGCTIQALSICRELAMSCWPTSHRPTP